MSISECDLKSIARPDRMRMKCASTSLLISFIFFMKVEIVSNYNISFYSIVPLTTCNHPFSRSRHKKMQEDEELAREKRQELVSQALVVANAKAQRYTKIVIFPSELSAMMKASRNFPRFVCAHLYRNLHPYTDAPLTAEQKRYLGENWEARCCFEQASGKPYSSASWYTIEWSDKEPVVEKSCCIIC
jgi:hypothetical protein